MRRKLLEIHDLDLKKAPEIARASELVVKHAYGMQKGEECYSGSGKHKNKAKCH